MSKSRQFDLGTILSVTNDTLLTDIENVYDILNFLTGENLLTHQIPIATAIASKYILGVYPRLGEMYIADGLITSTADAKSFLDGQKVKYGKKLRLSPIPKA